MTRVRPQVGPTISLFPFLAVLLCTMGSLLVLLVLFSSSAEHGDAEAAAAAAARERAEELELARDELAWQIEQLRLARAKTIDDLARARLQLAGIEADSRSLADEFDALERTAEALEAEPERSDEPLAELEQRLAAAKAAAEEARQAAADRPPAYAVVPYEGDSGTHRRPLYIECCIDGVFLQPEGIRLGPADFEGLPGPGNPLASALRAAKEQLASRPGESGEPAAQPYPLLLVRPSGVMAYYAARESLQSWGSDFGYQFIDEDWTLTFPPPDPAIAEAEMRAVEEARRRLEWLAQVRPPKRTKPTVQYRAATTRGGVVTTDGPSVLGDQSRWDWKEGQAAAGAGRGFRAGGDATGSQGGQGDALLGRGDGGEAGADGRWNAAGSVPEERYLGPSKFYGGPGGSGGESPTAAAAAGSGQSPASGGDGPGGTPGAEEAGLAGSPGGQFGGGPSSGGPTAAGQFDAGQSGAGSDGFSQGSAGGDAGEGTGGTTASASGRSAGSQANGGGGGGPSLPGMSQAAAASFGGPAATDDCADESCSLAGRRGSNWASLATRDRPIPLTRPIRLECAADEFRILGEGGRATARVPIGAHTADSIDPLVREVHATVGGWGMAGDRMYWKPELVLSATSDGEGRRADLEALLADSGLDTRRPATRDPVRPLPPVHRTGGLPPPR